MPPRRGNFRPSGTGQRSYRSNRGDVITNESGPLFNLNDSSVNSNMNDRFTFLLANSIGSKAVATVGSGARYRGTVIAIDHTSLAVVLGNPSLIENVLGEHEQEEELSKELLIESKDLMELELTEVDTSVKSIEANNSTRNNSSSSINNTSSSTSSLNSASAKGFRTDTDISGNVKIRERDLQRWTPDDSDSNLMSLEGGLEDDASNGGSWDQFAVNEKKFGVQSTWDESLYTTKLNKDAPDYQEKLREADKIAKEIESQGYNGNIHLAEERGIIIDDSGMDEEDKYSGVDRRGDELMAALRSGVSSGKKLPINQSGALPSARNGKYIPPKQRKEVHNLDPAIISSMKQPGSLSPSKKVNNDLPQFKSGTSKTPVQNYINKPTKKLSHQEESRLTTQQEINALKEFSQNFKVPVKFPSKHSPVLAKDRNRSVEQSKPINASNDQRSATKNSTPKLDKEELSPKVASSSTSSIVSSTQSSLPPKPSLPASPHVEQSKTTVSSKNNKKKMDPRAQPFKLNPAARSFTPGGASPLKPFNKINSPRQGVDSTTSPRTSKANLFTPQIFSPKNKSNNKAKKLLETTEFNFVLKSEENPERPFITLPTWGSNTSTSHRNIYSNDVPASNITPSHHIPRNMNANMNINMGGAAPFYGASPMMGGGYMNAIPNATQFGGYVRPIMGQGPPDPHFYQMNPIMAAGPYGPQMIPGRPMAMMPTQMDPMGGMGYMPQYNGGRGGGGGPSMRHNGGSSQVNYGNY